MDLNAYQYSAPFLWAAHPVVAIIDVLEGCTEEDPVLDTEDPVLDAIRNHLLRELIIISPARNQWI